MLEEARLGRPFWSLKTIWRSKDISLTLKIQVFHSTCLSILLYDCETWSLTKVMSNRLDSFATSCYRYILGFKRIDRIMNDIILEQVAQRPLLQTVKERQLC